jgi:hypothetical protein
MPVDSRRRGACLVPKGCPQWVSQYFLYFLPDPQGQGSFRPTLVRRTATGRWGSFSTRHWCSISTQIESRADHHPRKKPVQLRDQHRFGLIEQLPVEGYQQR